MIFNLQLPRGWIQHEISFPTVYYMSPFEEIQVGFRRLRILKEKRFQHFQGFKSLKVKLYEQIGFMAFNC